MKKYGKKIEIKEKNCVDLQRTSVTNGLTEGYQIAGKFRSLEV